MRVGYDGGSASSVQDNEEALGVLMDSIKKFGHEGKVKIGAYVAASDFYKDGKHGLDFKSPDRPPEMNKTAPEAIE